MFVRGDINVNAAHRLTVRHNYIDALNDVGFPTNILYYFPDNFYRFNNDQHSTVAQLNSTFGTGFNELRFTYQRIRDRRTNATNFPFVRVFLPDNTSLRAGTEQISRRATRSIRTSSRSPTTSRGRGERTPSRSARTTSSSSSTTCSSATTSATTSSPTSTLSSRAWRRPTTYSFSVTGNPLESADFTVRQFGFLCRRSVARVEPDDCDSYGVRVDLPIFPDTPTREPVLGNDVRLRHRHRAGEQAMVAARRGQLRSPAATAARNCAAASGCSRAARHTCGCRTSMATPATSSRASA